MVTVGVQVWDEADANHIVANVDRWHITFYNDCDALSYRQHALSPDGQLG